MWGVLCQIPQPYNHEFTLLITPAKLAVIIGQSVHFDMGKEVLGNLFAVVTALDRLRQVASDAVAADSMLPLASRQCPHAHAALRPSLAVADSVGRRQLKNSDGLAL
jgi:hypothetical protein